MKKALRVSLKWYKYSALVFLIGYLIYIVIDDYPLFRYVETREDLGDFLWGEVMFLFVYFLTFTIYYWLLALLISFIYSKISGGKAYAAPK